ncbi:MAG: hypothetical protein ACO1OB_33890 [Archangium sp.]
MKRAWLVGLLLSCAPTAQPGNHLVRRLLLEETALPPECGADAVFAARELELEFWTTSDGRSAARYVTQGELAFGSTTPVTLPAGVWRDGYGAYSSEFSLTTDAGVETQRLEVSLTNPTDGGVPNGALVFCSCLSCPADCRAQPGACVARIPFDVERLAQSSSPLPGPEVVVAGAKQFDVAVQTDEPVCALGPGAATRVSFEVWQFDGDTLTIPATAARYGEGVSGELKRDGDVFSSGELVVTGFRADVLEVTGTVRFASCDRTLPFIAVAR